MARGVALKSYANCLEMLLRLRQLCSHPFLLFPRQVSNQKINASVASLMRRFKEKHSSKKAEDDENAPAITEAFIENLAGSLKDLQHVDECPIW